MTYRERRMRKVERLREWAGKRASKAESSFTGARRSLDGIEPGQPILVGHHSERRHRRALEQHDSKMRQAFEHQDKASSMASRAANIEDAADRAIYSDDPDAIEHLQARIEGLEAERARVKAINAAIRKGTGWEARIVPPLNDSERNELLSLARHCPWHQVDKRGFPPYHLQNLGGNINRQKARLTVLQQQAQQRARVREVLAAEGRQEADEAPGDTTALGHDPSIQATAPVPLGSRIRTKVPDCDTDEHGDERTIPAGTVGEVVGFDGELHDISWEGGGWTRWTEAEIAQDAERLEITPETAPVG